MRPFTLAIVAVLFAVAVVAPAGAATLKCPPDSAKVGNFCIDKYEASVWEIALSNTSLLKKVQTGKATLADLTAGGGVQLGCTSAPFNHTNYPPNFPGGGQWTPVAGSVPPSPGVYAVSVPGVFPTACIDWFQAAQACRLSGKRLATNLEWQDAAAGTPDPGTDNGTTDCNISAVNDVVQTGSRSNCKSSWGVFDMVGNLGEWVADWADQHVATVSCTDWSTARGLNGDDRSCFGGSGDTSSNPVHGIPAAVTRGGVWFDGRSAGVYAVDTNSPSVAVSVRGFRCAR